ncbi:hypothetical protein GMDG_07677 [Pseudogymnoascus destructans 20631-21]|uniref:Enoyl reductase (ER) domain-containing protein n=1 Tax=Pseudogymnoascus destructans (strain ATCC MYA-4855 / 20631-21) TaxID=658429 RepID=L8FZE5_PSED2|nr:hypothetical protein GMDG_07677 [Pseudogymnoascus destructans 20631-21]
MSLPKTTDAWVTKGTTGLDNLVFESGRPLPAVEDHDVMVKFHGASLNYRDISILTGSYPFPRKDDIVALSDGAGEVVAVGSKVTQFKKGDKVVTLFNQGHQSGSINYASIATGLGGTTDGTLRGHGVFPEHGLVTMPSNLNYLEGATLIVAGLTAWNALYGLAPVKAGDYVLTQGTGGVSLFAVQFAKAAGAKVIATTSSAAKMEILKKLGADHVINYKETPNWGEMAKELTPGGVGVKHVIEVGGPGTMAQSLKAVQFDGIISLIGFVAAATKEQPQFLDALINVCTVRGLLVGSKDMFEDMNRAIVANNIKPVIDSKVFSFKEAREAMQYMADRKHVGKVCIKIE